MSHPVDVNSDPDREPAISVSRTYGLCIMSYAYDTITNIATIGNRPAAIAHLAWDLTQAPAPSWLDTSTPTTRSDGVQ